MSLHLGRWEGTQVKLTQACSGFIQNQDVWVADIRHGNGQPPLHPTRQLSALLVLCIKEVYLYGEDVRVREVWGCDGEGGVGGCEGEGGVGM